jgi:glycosyltransferase involved in cell wall biosynthesis
LPKIAHVISTPAGIGGAERVLQALAEGGAARGWTLLVLNPFAKDPEEAELAAVRAEYRGRKGAHWWNLPGLRRWLRAELEAFQPDLVHVHLFHAAVLYASVQSDCRSLLTQHHIGVFDNRTKVIERSLDRWAGRHFDRVVAVSEWGERRLVEDYGYPASLVSHIRNGWSGAPRARAPREVPTAVCVANLRPEKGHDTLLLAFARVLSIIPAARLRVVGDGKLRGRLEGMARGLGIHGAVDFVGAVEDVWGELSRAHLFVLASRVEPLGIAVMEAMAAGLPVVAPRVGGIPELVTHDETGILVPPAAMPEGLAAAVTQMLTSVERADAMGRNAIAAAAEMRSDAMVDRYYEVYDELRG